MHCVRRIGSHRGLADWAWALLAALHLRPGSRLFESALRSHPPRPTSSPPPPLPRRACNISLNLGVNYAMKAQPRGLGFDFPLAFTMTHMFFSLAGCTLVMVLRPSQRKLDPRAQLPRYWLRLLCLSFFYVLAIAANNMSLMNVGLSINQIIKSCAPLPVIVMAFLLQGKVVPRYKLAAVILLVSGAVLAVPYGHPVATLGGVLLAVLSTLSVGVKAVLSSILLDKSTESGLIPVVVAWYDALFSGCILLVVCAFTGDIPRMWTYFHDANKP